jgi:Kdo2-lipid IVA lauroyltransferase/acyltransferase
MLTRFGLALMRLVGRLPLAWVRALGCMLGYLLFFLAASRRHVVRVNLQLCFPALTELARRRLIRQVFVRFAQAWLDRGWLWHASAATLGRRLRLKGEVSILQGKAPLVLFAPHFVGLDAGWTALNAQVPRPFVTIYTNQSNIQVDAWILAGRRKVGQARLFGRVDGVKPVVQALREGAPLYLLPDMNFGPEDSVFVPFYGIPAATVPSLSRFARLGRAQVVPVLTRMTPQGYDVEVLAPWSDFPGADPQADTELMNRRLQAFIDTMPEQYFWVHRRFKDRPAGFPSVY